MLLKDYLPPVLTSTKTFTALLNAEQTEIDGVNISVQDIIDQCFISTATWGLAYWESMVGVTTDTSKDIDQRRSVVKAKVRGSGTVTVQFLENVASSYTNGNVQIIEHPSIYSFEVKFVGTMGIPPNLDDLEASINQIKPAHLAVTYTFVYTTWAPVQTVTWTTVKTSTWSGLLNGMVI